MSRRKWLLALVLVIVNYVFFAVLFNFIAHRLESRPPVNTTSDSPQVLVQGTLEQQPASTVTFLVVTNAPQANPIDTPVSLTTAALAPAPATDTPTPTPTGTAAPQSLTPVIATPAIPLCGPPATWSTYIVQPGNTLYSLARSTGTTVEAIRQANCLSDDTIYVGQVLWLPRIPIPTPVIWPTLTPLPTATLVASPTPLPTATSVPSPTPTATPLPTATSVPSPTPTDTPLPTATSVPSPTPTATPVESAA